MHGENAVLVVGEFRELGDIVPHALIRGVEKVRSVLVNLDAGFWLWLGVSVAAQMVAALDYQNALAQLCCSTFCNGQAEKSGADDDEIVSLDRKSTRLNSSHVAISYAVF